MQKNEDNQLPHKHLVPISMDQKHQNAKQQVSSINFSSISKICSGHEIMKQIL